MSDSIKLQGQESTIMFGTVEDLDDPEQLNRVRVRLPMHGGPRNTPKDTIPWARTLLPAGGVGPNQGGPGGQGGLSVAKNATVIVLVNHDNHEDITVLGVLPVNQTGKDPIGASASGRSSMALGGLKGGSTGGKHEPATGASKEVLKSSPASFPQIKGKYPQTHINVSESGMRNILHDVSGETYQASVHPTGTFTEMQADGNYVTYTIKDRKEAVDGQYTLGSEKDLAIFSNSDAQIRVKGTLFISAKNIMMTASDNYDYTAGSAITGSTKTMTLKGSSKIDLNP